MLARPSIFQIKVKDLLDISHVSFLVKTEVIISVVCIDGLLKKYIVKNRSHCFPKTKVKAIRLICLVASDALTLMRIYFRSCGSRRN